MSDTKTDLWVESSCWYCGHKPGGNLPEGQIASVSVTVSPTGEPNHWRVFVESPARGTMVMNDIRGGGWQRAMASGLRSAEIYVNGLLCTYQDRPVNRDRLRDTQKALRKFAVTQASAEIPQQETRGTCRVCESAWAYGEDENHASSCPAQPLALDDPHHICQETPYRYCPCGKFYDPRKERGS